MRRPAYLVFFLFFFFGGGCATVPDDQEELRNQLLSFSRAQSEQKEEQSQLMERLVKLEKKMEEFDKKWPFDRVQKPENGKPVENIDGAKPQHTDFVKLKADQEILRFTLERAIQNAEANSIRIESIQKVQTRLEKDFKAMKTRTEVKKKQREKKFVLEEPGKRVDKDFETIEALSPEDSYSMARKAFNSQNYERSLRFLTSMIRQFPEHDLAPNAYFWQGEAYYQLRDFNRANTSYSKVIKSYPESNKYPAALLKKGLSCFLADKKKEGEALLMELLAGFPDRPEAKRAEIFLQNN